MYCSQARHEVHSYGRMGLKKREMLLSSHHTASSDGGITLLASQLGVLAGAHTDVRHENPILKAVSHLHSA